MSKRLLVEAIQHLWVTTSIFYLTVTGTNSTDVTRCCNCEHTWTLWPGGVFELARETTTTMPTHYTLHSLWEIFWCAKILPTIVLSPMFRQTVLQKILLSISHHNEHTPCFTSMCISCCNYWISYNPIYKAVSHCNLPDFDQSKLNLGFLLYQTLDYD